jgi:predicted hydrocarbon binding protein
MKSMTKTSKKQRGFVMTSELILLSTVMAAGLVVGLTTMRDSVTAEMEDIAEAIGSLDQSYAFDGIINAENTAEISGSGFIDAVDVNAGDGATFEFVATDFAESAVSISNTPSAAGASPSQADGSLDN